MKDITKRPFMILSDFTAIYDFMCEIYDLRWRNGVPGPFLEYALSSDWMDLSLTHRDMIWEDNGKIVAFCFYESPFGQAYFSLRPGYEELAMEMVEYAVRNMADKDGNVLLNIFEGQDAIMDAAQKAGFTMYNNRNERIFDFKNILDFSLPDGFSFEEGAIDVAKMLKCCWKGFNHEEKEGPWNGEAECGYHLFTSPHATPEYAVAIKNTDGEYACFAGMWWTPQNNLAYMEPLCTVPEYRGIGLAAAALSEMYRRTKALGATHMTGGFNEFYKKIGFDKGIEWTYWKRA